MILIERMSGQGVRIGRYTVRVLSVEADGVVIALDPEAGEPACGEGPAAHDGRRVARLSGPAVALVAAAAG